MSAERSRLDERVVALGLAESRTKAQALIMAGQVLVDDVPVDKAGTRVRDDALVRLRGVASRFVSRGGDKLAGALDDLGVDPAGKCCLDVGASTGGFTDCLLQRGARRVYAVDVGYGQLDAKLRGDPRVVVLERTNARSLEAAQVPERDRPRGGGRLVHLAAPRRCRRWRAVAPGAEWLLLVKPQFEVGREQVGKGGVVRDDALRAAAVESRARGCRGARLALEIARADSRVAGPKGNREIFLHLRRAPS